jgi:hypothetical protein
MPRDVQNFHAAVGILDYGLNDQSNFRELPELRTDVVRDAGRAGVNANAGDEPRVGGLCFLRQTDLAVRPGGRICSRAIDECEKLVKGGIGPNRVALGWVLRTWRCDIADGDKVG